MGITHTKVLVVFNTNAVTTSDGYTSEQNSDWYASQRGLLDSNSQYYKLGFNFGTGGKAVTAYAAPLNLTGYGTGTPVLDDFVCATSQTPGQSPVNNNTKYVGLSLMEAIDACCSDNQIEAILFESLTLHTVCDGQIGAVINFIPVECYVAGAPNTAHLPKANRTTVIQGAGAGYSMTVNDTVVRSPMFSGWKRYQSAYALPVGRVGRWGCTRAQLVTWVGDAIWAETQSNLAKFHMVGGTNYTDYPGGSAVSSVLANTEFHAAGCTNLGQFNTVGATTAFATQYPNSLVGLLSTATKGTPFQAFGLLYSAGSQTDADYVPVTGAIGYNYQPLRGGWAFAWQSSSFKLGNLCLSTGGCAAVVNTQEPYADSVPGMPAIAAGLLAGLSFAEVVYLCNPGNVKYSVIGDPLYAPYKLTPHLAGKVEVLL